MPNTRRCWLVDCDVTSQSKPADVSLMVLPKSDPDRTSWWSKMGHRSNSLPVPKNTHCCTLHFNKSLPRRVWTPMSGIANAYNTAQRSTGFRNPENLARRQQEHIVNQRVARREIRIRQVKAEMLNDPSTMAAKFVTAEGQTVLNEQSM